MTWLNKNKLAGLTLAGLMIVTLTPANALADANTDLSVQLNQNIQNAQHLQSQLDDLKKQRDAVLSQIDQLQAQINDDLTQSAKLRDDIAATQKRLDEQKVKLKDRVRVMYESGDVSFWEVLLDSTDFSDFLDRFSALTMIVQQDKTLVDQYTADNNHLKQDQADLEAKAAERKGRQQQLLSLQNELDTKFNSVSSDLGSTKQKISDEQAAEAEAAAQIEANRAAAAASNSQSIGSNSGSSGSGDVPQFVASEAGSGVYIWPVPSSHTITSGYGPREGGEFHKGIDIGTPVGTPVVAVADGTVLFAGPASGFGHWVVIQHDNGLMSVYGHMYADGVRVSPGQRVKQGEVIALSGNDGESSGPHLHFSFATGISGGRMDYVNPMAYLQ